MWLWGGKRKSDPIRGRPEGNGIEDAVPHRNCETGEGTGETSKEKERSAFTTLRACEPRKIKSFEAKGASSGKIGNRMDASGKSPRDRYAGWDPLHWKKRRKRVYRTSTPCTKLE